MKKGPRFILISMGVALLVGWISYLMIILALFPGGSSFFSAKPVDPWENFIAVLLCNTAVFILPLVTFVLLRLYGKRSFEDWTAYHSLVLFIAMLLIMGIPYYRYL